MMMTSWKVRGAALAVRDALLLMDYPRTSLEVSSAPSSTLAFGSLLPSRLAAMQ